MFCPLKLILMPVLLDCSLGLNDLIVSSRELTVHAGDSALMGCVFQSTEEKHVIKVDWMVSSGEHIKDDYVLYYYSGVSVPVGRFLDRVSLVGNISRRDGSLLLQNVKETDQGNYTCEIRLEMESMVLKKIVVLHVLPEEPKELVVHVGDSTQMRCVFHSTEERHITKVDWMFLSEEHPKEEVVLRYYFKHTRTGYPQNWGHFQKRVNLVGDTSRNDGSIMLRGVKESDRGSYSCTIHMGDLTFRKTFVLDVIKSNPPRKEAGSMDRPINAHGSEEKQLQKPDLLPSAPHNEPGSILPDATSAPISGILAGNHLVTIVGIVCATIVLLPVLILIVKRTHGNKSSSTSTKSLENTQKAQPEKHIYSPITTRQVIEEEESSGKSEATYMTMVPDVSMMLTRLPWTDNPTNVSWSSASLEPHPTREREHPVRPSLRSTPNNPPEKWSAGIMIKAESAY